MRKRRFICAIILLSSTLLVSMNVSVAQREQLTNQARDHCYTLQTGKLNMVISPLGGRIISFKLGSYELLTQSVEHENYGSTLWLAPQSNWGWPPYDALDNQEYRVGLLDRNRLVLNSKPDPKSGIEIEKTWQVLDDKSIKIQYVLRNISTTEKSIGAWEVTRVPCGGIAFFPIGEESKIPASTLKPDLIKDSISWLKIDSVPKKEHQKLYSTAKEGWLAYAINKLLFVKEFPDISPDAYSPQQGEVEIYMNKDKIYIELENHGEYTKLQPNQSLSYSCVWKLIQIPGSVNCEPGNEQLLSFVRTQLVN